jgi:uncharacterized protein (TIGR02265 family)
MKSPRSVRAEDRAVFSQVVEALLTHGLKGQLSPRLRERLRQAGLDVDRPLLPVYPATLWMRCLALIVEETYPGLPPEQGFRRLAEAHVEGYGRTLIGRAVYRIMKLLGPRRMVQRLPQTLADTDNYTEATLEAQGPTAYVLRMNSVMEWPGYAEALLESLLRVAGAESPRVVKTRVEAESTTYLLTWAEPR